MDVNSKHNSKGKQLQTNSIVEDVYLHNMECRPPSSSSVKYRIGDKEYTVPLNPFAIVEFDENSSK
jgi:hypothetical protein